LGGVFAKNTSLETKLFVSRLVFFANTPPRHDISVHNNHLNNIKHVVDLTISNRLGSNIRFILLATHNKPYLHG